MVKPFFEAAAGVTQPARRMLLISLHFPPGSAAGALRWQKLAAFARARGWALDVLTLHPDDLPKPDLNRLKELPPDTRVFGVRMRQRLAKRAEHALWKVYRQLRPHPAHAGPVNTKAAAELSTTSIDGQRSLMGSLRRAYDAAMDYYNQADVIDSKLWYRLARHYERRVIGHATLVVMNTEPAQRAMQKLYPQRANRIIAVRNGYEDEPLPASRHGAKFTIAYAGTVYLDRDPRLVFEAASDVIRKLQLKPEDFGIELMGHIDGLGGTSVEGFAGRMGIADYVRALPPGSRSAAMDFLASASKLYEYVCFDAWLLALAQKGSATELLLRDSGADVVEPNDRERITNVLTERYQQFRAGQRPVRLAAKNESFSRREQARMLFDAVDRALTTG